VALPKSRQRLERVSRLIEGFETPYGMELLASVHWLAHYAENPAQGPAEAVAALQAWTPRKGKLFKPRHVEIAWLRLSETGWIDAAPTA
jgi:hypothetical protein